MGLRNSRALRSPVRTEALLVRKAPFSDADAIVTFFTEDRGLVAVVARSALKSSKRFPSLEPMHLLRIGYDDRAGAELGILAEAEISRTRLGLTANLESLEAAGHALRWARRAAPPSTPEPALWAILNAFLDDLDRSVGAAPTAQARLAGFGLRLLAAIGWGLDLERCVRCGRACNGSTSAFVDPAEGGLICRACGGARLLLRGNRRARFLAATQGDDAALRTDDPAAAIALVEDTLAAHTQ